MVLAMTRRFAISLAAGTALAAGVWLVLLLVVLPGRGRFASTPLGLAYDVPISLVFAVLAVEILLSLRALPLQENAPYLIVWTLGLAQLVLRVGLDAIEVSGHMTWLVLMLTHVVLRGLPRWFLAAVAAVFLQCAAINFFVFPRAASGVNGLLLGAALSAVCVALRAWLRRAPAGPVRSP